MDFIVQRALPGDIENWMALVNLVQDNFPGLVIDEYRRIAEKNIARGSALCARRDGRIIGVLLYSLHSRCLSCMAVHPDERGRGVGSAMVGEMLKAFPAGPIWVTTFREGDPKGAAPRALYRKFGFAEAELTEEFGYPVQKFILNWA